MDKGRALLLDFFRIFLCIGVFVYHYTPERPSSGPLMVNGFLVMSGFFAGLYIRRRSVFDTVAFYTSKVRRLVPLMVVALLMGILWKAYMGQLQTAWVPEPWGKFSMTHWLMYFNTPMWYMSVECSMLLLVPFFYYLSTKKYGILSCALVTTAFTSYLYLLIPGNNMFASGLYFSAVARCWQFVLGLVAADLCLHLQQKGGKDSALVRYATWPAALFFVITGIAFMVLKQESHLGWFNYSLPFDLMSTFFFVLLIPCLYLAKIQCSDALAGKVSYLAALTYPVYLTHVPLLAMTTYFEEYLPWFVKNPMPGYSSTAWAVLLTLIISVLLLKADSWFQRKLSR